MWLLIFSDFCAHFTYILIIPVKYLDTGIIRLVVPISLFWHYLPLFQHFSFVSILNSLHTYPSLISSLNLSPLPTFLISPFLAHLMCSAHSLRRFYSWWFSFPHFSLIPPSLCLNFSIYFSLTYSLSASPPHFPSLSGSIHDVIATRYKPQIKVTFLLLHN